MIKIALGLLAIGIAAMPFVDKGVAPEKVALAYHEGAQEAEPSGSKVVYIATAQTGAVCKIAEYTAHSGLQIVTAEPDCSRVYEGLERVTRLVSDSGGNVELKDDLGNTILATGPSDGFAFEAVTNNGAQITFALSDA